MDKKGFLDIIVGYVSLISDVDPLYVKWLSAQLLGHLLTKESYVNINPEREQLNLYTLLVGESFYARKTATQDLISYFYPLNVLLPNESSAEKFIANLSKKPNGVWLYGEFSKILKHINSGGYLSSVAETLNDLYKYVRETYKRELMNGEYVIKKPYPVFSSTLTPSVLKEQVTSEMMDGGLFGRLLLIPGESGSGKRKPIPKKADVLKGEIKEICDALSMSNLSAEFVLDDDALEIQNKIETELANDDEITSIAGRYGQAIIKLSAILAFSEKIGEIIKVDDDGYIKSENNSSNSSNSSNSYNSSVDDDDLLRVSFITNITIFTHITVFSRHIKDAYQMVKPCLEQARELKEYVSMNKKYIIKAKQYIKKNYPVKRSTTARMCNLDKREMNEAEGTLSDHNVLKVIRYKKNKASGGMTRIITVYCMREYDKKKCSNCKYKIYCKEEEK